jgi:hypothetical protein
LHEEFKRRIKTQTVLPSAETTAMLFWAPLASGQITMRKVDGGQSLAGRCGNLVTLEIAPNSIPAIATAPVHFCAAFTSQRQAPSVVHFTSVIHSIHRQSR